MKTVMLVEDDSAFLNRFCKIVVADDELELFAAGDDFGRGLANMKQGAERLGGSLQLEPSAHGTTLELLLPVAPA
jgi:signal transduction histidine kinase